MAAPRSFKPDAKLPPNLESLFWDCDFQSLTLGKYQSFIIRRILDRGDWDALTWLRHTVGDDTIRGWFLEKSGGKLDPRKMRLWQVILDLPEREVDDWVRKARQSIWYGRQGG